MCGGEGPQAQVGPAHTGTPDLDLDSQRFCLPPLQRAQLIQIPNSRSSDVTIFFFGNQFFCFCARVLHVSKVSIREAAKTFFDFFFAKQNFILK